MKVVLLLSVVVGMVGLVHLKQCQMDDKQMADRLGTLAQTVGKISSTMTNIEIASNGVCQGDWSRLYSSCYIVKTDPLTWKAAKEACVKEGAHLASIEDARENILLLALARVNKKLGPTKSHNIWTSGHDTTTEGKFVWDNTNSPITFTNWMEGEPNNYGSGEDCIAMKTSDGHFHWNDYPCDYPLPYICEKDVGGQ